MGGGETLSRGGRWLLSSRLLLLAVAAAPAALAATPGVRTTRGLPLRPVRQAPLPAGEAPPSPGPGERDTIEALDLRLGPIPRTVVLSELDAPPSFADVAHLPGVHLSLDLPRGNMVPPHLWRRLEEVASLHLRLVAPLLPVHLHQLPRLHHLQGITLRVPEGQDAGALVGLRRLPPLARVRVHLEGSISRERVLPFVTGTRATIVLNLQDLVDATGHLRSWARSVPRQRMEIRLAAPVGAHGLALIETLGPSTVLLDCRRGFPEPRMLRRLAHKGRTLRLRLGPSLHPEDLRRIRGLPGLEIELWLAGAARRTARRAIEVLARSMGPPSPSGGRRSSSPRPPVR